MGTSALENGFYLEVLSSFYLPCCQLANISFSLVAPVLFSI